MATGSDSSNSDTSNGQIKNVSKNYVLFFTDMLSHSRKTSTHHQKGKINSYLFNASSRKYSTPLPLS